MTNCIISIETLSTKFDTANENKSYTELFKYNIINILLSIIPS